VGAGLEPVPNPNTITSKIATSTSVIPLIPLIHMMAAGWALG
jgi:hypothetical protein